MDCMFLNHTQINSLCVLAKKCGLLFSFKTMIFKTFVALEEKKSLSLSNGHDCIFLGWKIVAKSLPKLKVTVFLL